MIKRLWLRGQARARIYRRLILRERPLSRSFPGVSARVPVRGRYSSRARLTRTWRSSPIRTPPRSAGASMKGTGASPYGMNSRPCTPPGAVARSAGRRAAMSSAVGGTTRCSPAPPAMGDGPRDEVHNPLPVVRPALPPCAVRPAPYLPRPVGAAAGDRPVLPAQAGAAQHEARRRVCPSARASPPPAATPFPDARGVKTG